jgi:hypothetical protein
LTIPLFPFKTFNLFFHHGWRTEDKENKAASIKVVVYKQERILQQFSLLYCCLAFDAL